MKSIKYWELFGAIFTILVGTLLHFTFDFSHQNHFVALFAAVNESTWEHLKLAFWPTFVFAILEWLVFHRQIKNFCLASFVKLFSMPLLIIAFFYFWLAFLPDNFIYDISIFIVSVILGYVFSYKIIKSEKTWGPEWLWMILIIIGLLKFSLFTYFPPKIFLFRDPIEGTYGIPASSNDNTDLFLYQKEATTTPPAGIDEKELDAYLSGTGESGAVKDVAISDKLYYVDKDGTVWVKFTITPIPANLTDPATGIVKKTVGGSWESVNFGTAGLGIGLPSEVHHALGFDSEIFDFTSCAEFYPIMKSNPAQCQVPDGTKYYDIKTFNECSIIYPNNISGGICTTPEGYIFNK